ncbi:DMT family transporter [Corynebacterium pseudopelargi]|uniref:DMT family transporter n=1 Tax=Corynebacterium pseudopelargi TaxID=2080757 RepID=UPI000F4D8662|nr:DMT family transporter [Corynebacterium pseudopelargi]
MLGNILAMAFALLSALTIAWGTVVRHRIAENAPAGGSPFLQAIRRPAWWAGTFLALAGYGFQIIALGFGALLVVQPILVLSLMFTLPLSAHFAGRRIARDEFLWALALTIAVAVLVLLGRPEAGDPQPPLERWIPAMVIGVVALISLERYAQRQIRNEKALWLGVVTGGIYGYVAVLSKATVDIFTHEGFLALLTAWEGYTLLAGAIIGTVVQQYAFNAGDLKNSLPAMTILEPIVAFALGYAVLGEKFQVSGFNWFFMALALATMIVSTIALSRKGVGAQKS